MESKFKVKDNVVIKNHPNRDMLGKIVEIKTVAYAKFKEGVGFEDQAIYKVYLDGKSLGWSPEEDLEEIESK